MHEAGMSESCGGGATYSYKLRFPPSASRTTHAIEMEAHGTSYLNLGQFREEKSLLQKEGEAETSLRKLWRRYNVDLYLSLMSEYQHQRTE